MREFLAKHWVDLIQTIFLFIGFGFTSINLIRERKSRQISNLASLNQAHRDIWDRYFAIENRQIFDLHRDLEASPVTEAERMWLLQVFHHLELSQKAMGAGVLMEIEGLDQDAREFFEYPAVREVWKRSFSQRGE